MRQSGPSSAVAIHRLSSLTQRQEMMLGWPCGDEEHVLRNDKEGAQCRPQEGLGPHISELLPKLACLQSGFYRPTQRFFISCWGVGWGGGFPSFLFLHKPGEAMILTRGREKHPTQPGPLNSLRALSSTNTVAQWSLAQSFPHETEESSRNVLRVGGILAGHGGHFSFPSSIVPRAVYSLPATLAFSLALTHKGRFFPRLPCWLIFSFFRSRWKQDVFCPCPSNLQCLSSHHGDFLIVPSLHLPALSRLIS